MGSQVQITAASLLSGVLLTTATPVVEASQRYAVGWCQVAHGEWAFDVSPVLTARSYISDYQRKNPKFRLFNFAEFRQKATVTLLDKPKLGTIERTESGWQFQPPPLNKDGTYVGRDRFVFRVDHGEVSIFVHYYIEVIGNDPLTYIGSDGQRHAYDYCELNFWKISQSGQPDATSSDLTAWQRSAQLSALIASAQQTVTGFTDLPTTSLGQTTGQGTSATITLDTTAAGHGWYVDPTPLNNTDDYLPTSNPSVWQAKADSAAAGKMDMLSVLLHEYGHALGLLPFGFIRRNAASGNNNNGNGNSNSNARAASPVAVRGHDYLTAVNPTLLNGKFQSGSSGGANANTGANTGAKARAIAAAYRLQGWENFGADSAAPHPASTQTQAITLHEASRTSSQGQRQSQSQTRLAQAFNGSSSSVSRLI